MIKMKIMYETSDGKLFDKEIDARYHENLYNNIKYYSYVYFNNEFSLMGKQPKYYDDANYDDAVAVDIEESEVIFIPDMDAFNAICHYAPEYMPDYDCSSLVPHPGLYVWVEMQGSFIPISELILLEDDILEREGLNRKELEELKEMEKNLWS